MSAAETPTRRSKRTPAASKKYGDDFVTGDTLTDKTDSPKAAVLPRPPTSKDPERDPKQSQESPSDKGESESRTRRTSKRVARDGQVQPQEPTVKKSKRDSSNSKGSSVKESQESTTTGPSQNTASHNLRKNTASEKSSGNLISSPKTVAAAAGTKQTSDNSASRQTEEKCVSSSRAKTRSSGSVDSEGSPKQSSNNVSSLLAKEQSAPQSSVGTSRKSSKNVDSSQTPGNTPSPEKAITKSPEKANTPQALKKAATSRDVNDPESEALMWQTLATLPSEGDPLLSVREDMELQLIEVRVREEEAGQLALKGPVKFMPPSKIYYALKHALETHKSKGAQVKAGAVQVALRVSKCKTPVPVAIHKADTTAKKNPPSNSSQAKKSRKRTSVTKVDVIRTKEVCMASEPSMGHRIVSPSKSQTKSSQRIHPPTPKTPGVITPQRTFVPLAKRLRTCPTQTTENDFNVCQAVDQNQDVKTMGKVLKVSADKVSKLALRAPSKRNKNKKTQTKVSVNDINSLILDSLHSPHGEDVKEAEGAESAAEPVPDPGADPCSLLYDGATDSQADRRIQAMLFGQDQDAWMSKSQVGVMSNVMKEHGNVKKPNAKVSIESWSLALASASMNSVTA